NNVVCESPRRFAATPFAKGGEGSALRSRFGAWAGLSAANAYGKSTPLPLGGRGRGRGGWSPPTTAAPARTRSSIPWVRTPPHLNPRSKSKGGTVGAPFAFTHLGGEGGITRGYAARPSGPLATLAVQPRGARLSNPVVLAVGSNPASSDPTIRKGATRAPFLIVSGGAGGIRTHRTPARTPDFESGPFDHSGTSPVKAADSTRSRRTAPR